MSQTFTELAADAQRILDETPIDDLLALQTAVSYRDTMQFMERQWRLEA